MLAKSRHAPDPREPVPAVAGEERRVVVDHETRKAAERLGRGILRTTRVGDWGVAPRCTRAARVVGSNRYPHRYAPYRDPGTEPVTTHNRG